MEALQSTSIRPPRTLTKTHAEHRRASKKRILASVVHFQQRPSQGSAEAMVCLCKSSGQKPSVRPTLSDWPKQNCSERNNHIKRAIAT
ncbi:hypothetical protein QE152_g6974 [Popillia japonica]|uniref:Uncharacterized protein n=1 Tax=Popillia japonica TaxID=7064 RepID=A0AAW1MGH8_POPJA